MDINQLPQYLETMRDRLITETQDRILFAAGFTLKGEMIDRIFGRGIATDGGKIGTYSTTPIYAQKEDFVRKAAFVKQGKTNTGDFKNGKERKSMYLKSGYKEFRDVQARQTGYVDEKVTGSLEKSITLVRLESGAVIAITDDFESKKRQGQEKHFGKDIFTPADNDVNVFMLAVTDEIDHLFGQL